MKRFSITLFALIAVLLSTLPLRADEPVRFDSRSWNFGRIEESGGKVEHVFRFVNTSASPVVIGRVATSCGCTAVDYSARPVKPNEESTLTVVYDPEGRPGRFEKSIDVGFAGYEQAVKLTVSGTVNPRPRTVVDDYPFVLAGGVRADVANRTFGYLPQGKTVSMTIGIVNTTDREVKIDTLWSVRSGFMQFDFPAWLRAGEKGLVTLTYDISKGEHYGVLSDAVRLKIDGRAADIPLSASAVAVDDFDKTGRQRPEARFSPVFHNFGKVKAGQSVSTEVEVRNDGNAPLVIRNVAERTGTEFALTAGTVIEPNTALRVKLEFKPAADAFDTVFGGAIIITNDPERPMRELRVAGEVE